MSGSSERARQVDLDRLATEVGLDAAGAAALFDVVDLLDSQFTLRRSLTDPNATAQARSALATRVLEGQVPAAVSTLVGRAVAEPWESSRALTDALERQAVRGALAAADAAGRLDDVRDELFRFARTVIGSQELRDAVNDRAVPREGRQQLVADLLADRANPVSVLLAGRAVLGRRRNFTGSIQGYLDLASELKDRGRARVSVAVPLTFEQTEELRAQLSRIYSRPIDLEVTVDPDLIGGITVTVADEKIDGSIAARLAEVRQQLQ